MLETLVSFVNLTQSTVYYLFYYSYKTGQFLVNCINYVLYYFNGILSSLFNILSAISESCVIFVQDILQYVQQFVNVILGTCDGIISGTVFVYLKTVTSLQTAIHLLIVLGTCVVQSVLNIYNFIIQIILLTKKIIILFGSGVWFLITLLPIFLYYGCVLFISFMHNLTEEVSDICNNGISNIKTMVKDSIIFVTDVPLESLAGLLITLSLVYIIAQFYVIIGFYIKQQLRKIIIWARRQYLDIQEGLSHIYLMMPRRASQEEQRREPPIDRTAVNVEEKNLKNEEKYCVICQERLKCVLLLPCKHLCLCPECTTELQYYNDTCPICRTNIDSSMKIFV